VPNVTPMIDVMLVLLCIFMIITPALSNGMVTDPPEASHATPRPDDEGMHTLAIDAGGTFRLDQRAIGRGDLGPALRALYPADAAHRILFLRAHRRLDFAVVDSALGVARASGVRTVGLVTEVPRAPGASAPEARRP